MIKKQITNSEITEIIISSSKPTAYTGQSFPFTALPDRVFEILLYQIFQVRIDTKDSSLNDKFDGVVLMQGVGERGRDCILAKKGANVGLIQCKQINKNITKPEVLKEILKFTLHYIIDKSLITDLDNFTYHLAVSKGLAETSIVLINNFNKNYRSEDIKQYCEELISKNVSLKALKYDNHKTEIFKVLDKIKVIYICPSDLSRYLHEHESLLKQFFRVLTMTDNALLESIIDTYLSPILNKIIPKGERENKDFAFRFKEYIQRVYTHYSSSRTLVFGNQQKKLEDFYYPLNLECKNEESNLKPLKICTLNYEEDFLPQFKKVIIVDNGGMGKSTIMKWLFLNVIKFKKGIPIFIELRKLKNGKTIIEEIISELNPIDQNLERELVTKLIAQGNFIFFFDGYDEISDADREFVTTDLQSFISKSSNNLFLLTSRPETALNTFSDFKEFKVKKMEKTEAFELIKKIGNNSEKSLRLIDKLKENEFENIDDFLQSPLLVSLLYKKFEHRENIPIQLQEFYYDVFEALYQDHDLTKGDSFVRNKKTKLSFNDFFQILREFAFFTFKKGEIEYNDAILYKYLEEVSNRLPNIKFKITDLAEDLVKSVPLFNKEGLQYRWSHKSFQEYFTSEYICRDSKEKQLDILGEMYKSPKSEKYLFIFKLCYDIDFKSFREAVIVPYLNEFVDHFENSFQNLNFLHDNESTDIILRKLITFNRSYLVITKTDRALMSSLFENIKEDIFNEGKLENLPDFMDDNHKIMFISFSTITVIGSRKKSDILELLIDKKSNLLKSFRNEKKKNSDEKKEIKSNLPDYVIVNLQNNYSNESLENLIYFNNLLRSHFSNSRSQHLDIERCKKFLENYYDEIANVSVDYHAGF
ncbi:NACHT domain-containing protein [Flavobacterium pectinovorum]|uniref:NACHT domain-containing protein n=1 Tax=Flavobacterium pectinovorum TaxID=29533 RepID=A0A502EPF1_9FLAO|nr:NACHT domain-containing protein [Flavobacterium pectinovorum]TPG38380.1 NACHT domain-containing protein [Flavobacterium pectinovorum]